MDISRWAPSGVARSLRATNLWSLRWKLMLPYAVLTWVFAAGVGYGVREMYLSSLQDRLDGELGQASTAASDLANREMRQYLTTARNISYSEGVAEAVTANDREALDRLTMQKGQWVVGDGPWPEHEASSTATTVEARPPDTARPEPSSTPTGV